MADHGGTGVGGHTRGPVGRPVIDDDHQIGFGDLGSSTHGRRDTLLLVLGWDDNGDA